MGDFELDLAKIFQDAHRIIFAYLEIEIRAIGLLEQLKRTGRHVVESKKEHRFSVDSMDLEFGEQSALNPYEGGFSSDEDAGLQISGDIRDDPPIICGRCVKRYDSAKLNKIFIRLTSPSGLARGYFMDGNTPYCETCKPLVVPSDVKYRTVFSDETIEINLASPEIDGYPIQFDATKHPVILKRGPVSYILMDTFIIRRAYDHRLDLAGDPVTDFSIMTIKEAFDEVSEVVKHF